MKPLTAFFLHLRSNWLILVAAIALLGFVIFLSFFNPPAAQTRVEDIEKNPPLTLFCFDFALVQLIQSDVDAGCSVGSESLGADPLLAPTTQVTQLNPILLARFNAAQAVAKTEGIPLEITSGFRSFEYQEMLFAREVKLKGSEEEAMKWVLPPQLSHHPMGTAIDVNYDYDEQSTMWLEINGYKFGLCRVYENEWWHFEAVTSPGTICPPMKANAFSD